MCIRRQDNPQEVRTLYETGLTTVFLPEFDAMMATEQNNPHHKYTVGEHTIVSLTHVRGEKVLRLAMLFHDVAKPVCITRDEEGIHHFHGHPGVGSEMTRKILRRLKFDNDTVQGVCALVAGHDDNPPATLRNVRRAMVRIGPGAFPHIFEVKRADILAQSSFKQQEKLEYLKEFESCYREITESRQCLSIKELAVNGRDLMEIGIPAGPGLGEVLSHLLDLVIEEPEKNTREYLLHTAKEYSIL